MSSDMKIIKQIEKQLGYKLRLVPLEKIMGWRNIGYAFDKTGQVQGLNLNKEKINISFLKNLSELTYLSWIEDQITDNTIIPPRDLTNLTQIRCQAK